MEFLVNQFKFLGLNDKEVRVFTALSTFGRMNMTKLSSRARLSRTTVDAIVRRLVAQGLVTQERVLGHYEYAVKLDEVADKLGWIEQRLRPNNSGSTSARPTSNVAQDAEKHPSSSTNLETAFHTHPKERATLLVAGNVPHTQSEQFIQNCVSHSNESGTKLDILVSSHVWKCLSVETRELFTTHTPRVCTLPTSCCLEHINMVAFRDLIITLDQHSHILESIESPVTIGIIQHFLRSIRELGWNCNLHDVRKSHQQ